MLRIAATATVTRFIVADGTSMTWERLVQSVSDVPEIVSYSGHAITHSTEPAEVGIRGEQPIIDEMATLFHVRKQNAYL